MPANHPIKSDGPVETQETGRVLRFEPRRAARWPRPASPPPFGRSAVETIETDARGGDDEEYRYRMRANLAAIVLVAFLIWCGYWLFNTLTELRKDEDCVLSGRTNCARIEVPPSR